MFMPSTKITTGITGFFSYFMHWIENIMMLFAFFFYSLALCPLCLIKIAYHFTKFTGGFYRIFLLVLWAVIGVPMMLFLVLRDVGYMISMMSFHNGCKMGIYDNHHVEAEIPDEAKIYVINEIRCAVISIFKIIVQSQ
jgi:hypothetical protein